MGEKFIQVAKKNFNSFQGDWHSNLINRIIKYHTINLLNKYETNLHDEQEDVLKKLLS